MKKGVHTYKKLKPCEACGENFLGVPISRFCKRGCYLAFNAATPEPERSERVRAARKAWKLANKEKVKAQSNTEEYRSKIKAWREANPDKIKDYGRMYRTRNKERVVDSATRYLLSERGRKAQQKYRETFWKTPRLRISRIARAAINRAKASGIEFDVNLESFLCEYPPMNCVCCGVGFNYGAAPSSKRMRDSPSIDRVNNAKGYTLENSKIICWGCNVDKSNLTIERAEMFLSYMREHSPKPHIVERVA